MPLMGSLIERQLKEKKNHWTSRNVHMNFQTWNANRIKALKRKEYPTIVGQLQWCNICVVGISERE